MRRSKIRNPTIDASIFDFVQGVLLLRFPKKATESDRQAIVSFTGKFQQLTGPIMVKAVEDTAFYRFNRLVSLNEVGGAPDRFGTTLESFHAFNLERQRKYPNAMTASSTHDTKRSEDVRARIDVLSEIEKTWRKRVQQWGCWNQKHNRKIDGLPAPSRNAEYMIYQTLVGTWPGDPAAGPGWDDYVQRIRSYMIKVEREAKESTSWVNPNRPYEEAVFQFVTHVLAVNPQSPFLVDLASFAAQVAQHGYWNSLSQLVLKMTVPGVPDFYQGTEFWNYTLVDPDNRRPVDFVQHRRWLDKLLDQMGQAISCPDRGVVLDKWIEHDPIADCESGADVTSLLADLMEQRANGRIKLLIMLVGLRLRRKYQPMFATGEYLPLQVSGSQAQQIIALARSGDGRSCIAIAP